MARTREKKTRRIVRISEATAKRRWAKLWAYSYADLAELFAISEVAVRKAVVSGRLDPSDLESVCRFWAEGAFRLSTDELRDLELGATTPVAADGLTPTLRVIR